LKIDKSNGGKYMENSMRIINKCAVKKLDSINKSGIQMAPYESDNNESLNVQSFWKAEQFRKGKRKDIIIEFNDKCYNACITRENTEHKKGNNLRLMWTNGGLYTEIQKAFSKVNHVMCFSKTNSGIRFKLDILSDEEMDNKLNKT